MQLYQAQISKKIKKTKIFSWLLKKMRYNIICYDFAELCNGSTTDSDSVCWGSNPYSAAIKKHLALC